jgi:hypothetical protein
MQHVLLMISDDLELISTVPDWDITGPKRPAQPPGDEPSATTPHRHSNLRVNQSSG